MPISTTTNRVVLAGNGSSTVFPFAYEFFSQSDLKVFLYQSSAIQAQTLNTHYTVSGTPNQQGVYTQGGSVITNCAIPTGTLVVLTRDPSLVQNYALLQNGSINSLALVQQLDYLTLLLQRTDDRLDRAMLLQDGSAQNFDPQIPFIINASSVLMTNSTATGWTQGPQADQIFGAQSAAIAAAASMVAAGLSAASAVVSDLSAQSSAVSAGNNAILSASAALSASISASIVGSSAFWGSIAQSAAVSATDQAILSGSGALSASNSAALANSAAISAGNQAVLSGSAAVSATNQAILAAVSALQASSSVGAISLPLVVPSGGTGTQGKTAGAVAVWAGSSAMTTAGVTTAGQLLMASPTNNPSYGTPNFLENLLVNSAFDFWQAFPSGSSVASGNQVYFADQWYIHNTLGTNGVVTNTRTAGQNAQSINACQVQITVAPTAAIITQGCELWQTLENALVMSRIVGTTTGFVSAKVKALGNVTQVGVTGFQRNSEIKVANTDSSCFSEQVFAVNSASWTACLAAVTLGTTAVGSTGVIALRMRISGVSSGSAHVLSNGFIVEQAGLWAGDGSVQPGWMRRKINPDGELMDCQRFFEKTYDPTAAVGALSATGATQFTYPVSGCWLPERYKIEKRSAPAVTYYSPVTGAATKGANTSSGGDVAMTAGVQGLYGHASQSVNSTNHTVQWHYTSDSRI